MSLPEDSALRLFCSNELEFYYKYFNQFTKSVIREKKILEFETPNRMKVTYEYDVGGKVAPAEQLFVFLPNTRKNWMKVFWMGTRLAICSSEKIGKEVYNKIEDDLIALQKELQYEGTALEYWEKRVWPGHIPCFVEGSFMKNSIETGQLIVEFYDSFETYERPKSKCSLFDERRYVYNYALEFGNSHWIYVKAPDKFQVEMSPEDNRADKIKGNDPEIQAYRIHPGHGSKTIKFNIDILVPQTLKWWYRMIIYFGVAYIIAFFWIACAHIKEGEPLSPAFAQVGISLVAAIIASRGWMMNDETVLKRVSNYMTGIAVSILICLVLLYFIAAFK